MQHPFTPTPAEGHGNQRTSILATLLTALFGALSITGASEPEKKPAYPPTLGGGAPCGSCIAPEKLSWKTVIPPEKEPGQPLVISGKIFQPDGTTPAESTVLFVYQTDVTGYYNEKDDASHPRLKGWMKIGADGNYDFARSNRAHIRIAPPRPTSMRMFTAPVIPSVRSRIIGSRAIRASTRKS